MEALSVHSASMHEVKKEELSSNDIGHVFIDFLIIVSVHPKLESSYNLLKTTLVINSSLVFFLS